jgi:TorA maturation chaperone TorD
VIHFIRMGEQIVDTPENRNGQTGDERAAMAETAGGRAVIYHLFVEFFSRLPDQALLSRILGNDFQTVLDNLDGLQGSRYQNAVNQIRSFISKGRSLASEERLRKLAVDRTRILRGVGTRSLKPPYEGMYTDRKEMGESVLEVKGLYRKAGIVPDETVHETPDYLCIELDFMRQMCLREQEQWSSGADVFETLETEHSFLREHLGTWIHEFCRRAEKEAITGFFRGLLGILDEVIATDMKYLQSICRSSARPPHRPSSN